MGMPMLTRDYAKMLLLLCRWGMYAPGIVGIILGIILLGVTKDSPESAGFPPVEETATKKEPSGATLPRPFNLRIIGMQ